MVEITQVVESGIGRPHRIVPLVHVSVDSQSVSPRRRSHELPHAGCQYAGTRIGVEVGLDQGDIQQFFRHSTLAEPGPDHVRV